MIKNVMESHSDYFYSSTCLFIMKHNSDTIFPKIVVKWT